MKLSLNNSADAVYIGLRDSKIIESETIATGIIFDFDNNEQIVGSEILQIKQKAPEELSLITVSFLEDDKLQLKEILNCLASTITQ